MNICGLEITSFCGPGSTMVEQPSTSGQQKQLPLACFLLTHLVQTAPWPIKNVSLSLLLFLNVALAVQH